MVEFSEDHGADHGRVHGGEPMLVLCKIYKSHACSSSRSARGCVPRQSACKKRKDTDDHRKAASLQPPALVPAATPPDDADEVPSRHNTSTLGRYAGYLPRHLKRHEQITREAELNLPLPARTNDLTHSPIGERKQNPKQWTTVLVNTVLFVAEATTIRIDQETLQSLCPHEGQSGDSSSIGAVRTHPVPLTQILHCGRQQLAGTPPTKASWCVRYSDHEGGQQGLKCRYGCHRPKGVSTVVHNTGLTQKLTPGSPKA
ncbi:hypothetical protein HU200_041774 [Digitaria exilis]|uniref:Uncharacterized protein n=1 Tax=Digitaria exilis TaxID=1010633 RepID=A0A835BBR3_9POAL|nr:hypothetical protein HU200_041774 [Digitaria exilis]